MSDDDARWEIGKGLATIAVAIAREDGSDDDIRARLLEVMLALQISDTEAPSLLRAAAASVSVLPHPQMETIEETERRRPIREILGVHSLDEQLTAMLRARQLLEDLAGQLEG